MKIALIGAGAAGAACISVLRLRGADFLVFEKARGTGGRLATRRISGVLTDSDLYYDHGAPFFDLPNQIRDELSQHIKTQTIAQDINGFVATPTMPQLVKDLILDSPIHLQTEIESISGQAKQWLLHEKKKPERPEDARTFGPFETVVITAPAPQAIKLLSSVNCEWKAEIEKINYAPCWALMFSLQRRTSQTNHSGSSYFSHLTLQNTKPGRKLSSEVETWVAHATPQWSEENLELSPETANSLLLPQALSIVGADPHQVIHSTAHRWRYSTVTQALGINYMWDSENGLGYAGDGCRGTGVAGALSSGFALGHRINSSVKL